MRDRALSVLALTTTLVISLPGQLVSGQIDLSQWEYLAPLHLERASDKGVVECKISPEVLDAAQAGLSDLMVVADNSSRVGYVVRQSKSQTRKEVYSGKMYNLTHVPGKETSVTVDLGEKQIKNAVQVLTDGANFRRKVRIEGSDDAVEWRVVRDEAFLFRADGDGNGGALEKNIVQIADNDQRHLRITVFNDSDDTGSLQVERVTSWRQTRIPAETAAVGVASTAVTQKKRFTQIMLDLGFRNMPLQEVRLNVGDKNFFRKVQIQGRNSEARVVRTVVEDSPKLEKIVPVPWTPVAKGSIFRFTTGSGVEESLAVKLRDVRYRYLRILIENRDDPPLQFKGASLTRFVQYLLFGAWSDTGYTLYFGNAKARKSQYDVERFIDRLRKDGVVQATLGLPVPNPQYSAPVTELPWSERHEGILWVALLAMLAVLGLLVYRIALSTKSASAQGGKGVNH